MKKIKIGIGLSLALIFSTFSSCDESNLELSPQNPTEASYFQEEIEFERGAYALYSRLVRYYTHVGNQNNIVWPIWHLPGDDVTTPGGDPFEIFSNINAGNTPLDYYFTSSYQLIGRVNAFLEKLDEVEEGVYVTPNLKEYHRGEAHFLRGLAYFHLWNTFGSAAPLVLERVKSTDEFFPESSSGTELLDQAIEDFSVAAPLLPLSWSDQLLGRATSNSANGYLGKALVFRATVTNNSADYAEAITAFNALSGVSLVPDFSDNFAFDTENNAESLFEFQASTNLGDNPWVGDPDAWDDIGVMNVYWELYNPDAWTLFGRQAFYGTEKLINSFDPNDPRLEQTVDPETGRIQKYISRNRQNSIDLGSVNNPRMLRYADALLLKAEAILFSGGSKAEAIDLINEVRTRARNMGDGTAPANHSNAETNEDVIFEWIRSERFLELAAEGQRWWDLRRWKLGGDLPFELTNEFFDSQNPNISFNPETHLNFPIPVSEADNNPNITQNTGY